AIHRHAAASIARNGPGGIDPTAATRSRYGGLKDASHWISAKADTRTAAVTPAIAATRARSTVRRSSPVPTTPSATPYGKNAASEWKYEPRVECNVKTRLSTRYTRPSRQANTRTSGAARRIAITRPGTS